MKIAAVLGELLKPFDFIGLSGPLGAGKTQFVRGVAQGCRVDLGDVSSPTYSLLHQYRGRMQLTHVDLYRLNSHEALESIGYFDALAERGAMLVEWCEQIPSSIPDDALLLSLIAVDQFTRKILARSTGQRSSELLAHWTESNT
jgi:tRNA threonylcarbamoyladenosine biosynthesis protein TsaE